MEYIIKNINDYKDIEIDKFKSIIKKEKYNKISKLRNYNDKLRSLVGELSLIELLNKNNIKYQDIEIIYNEFGKPLIKDLKYFYNISHSGDYVICTLSNKPIGIDIEKIKDIDLKISNQFATNKEKEYIRNNKTFFQIYTLKEAYFKMLGTNLNNILDIEFNISNNNIICSDSNINAYFINELDDYVISYIETK